MEVVFLKAKQRLIKEISLEGKKPYPLVKNFTSHHHKFDKTEDCLLYTSDAADE